MYNQITIPNTMGLTIDQAATLLNVNKKTIERHIKLADEDPKKLKAYSIGRSLRIMAGDLLDYIQRNYKQYTPAIGN